MIWRVCVSRKQESFVLIETDDDTAERSKADIMRTLFKHVIDRCQCGHMGVTHMSTCFRDDGICTPYKCYYPECSCKEFI